MSPACPQTIQITSASRMCPPSVPRTFGFYPFVVNGRVGIHWAFVVRSVYTPQLLFLQISPIFQATNPPIFIFIGYRGVQIPFPYSLEAPAHFIAPKLENLIDPLRSSELCFLQWFPIWSQLVVFVGLHAPSASMCQRHVTTTQVGPVPVNAWHQMFFIWCNTHIPQYIYASLQGAEHVCLPVGLVHPCSSPSVSVPDRRD